ncbi:hypothetical protein DFH09DRAFT_1167208 [Mycena vulgaris]|nr:hypothetical protein DFH09DRAFT_1167208 [Mycena vulgaris]
MAVLPCTLSSVLTTDVSLGLVWSSCIHKWYTGLGLSPTNGFNACTHLMAIPPGSSPVSPVPVDSPATERPGFIGNNGSATFLLPLALHCPCSWLYLTTRLLRLLRRRLP